MKSVATAALLFALLMFQIVAACAGELEDAMSRLANEMAARLPADIERPVVVAVMNFEADGPRRATKLADILAGELSKHAHAFTVVARSKAQLLAGISEINYGLSGFVDQKTAARAGHQLGAKALIHGRSELTVTREKLTAGIITVETGKIELWASAEAARTHPASFGATRSMVVPGWGQWACGQKGTGTFLMLATVGLGSGAFYASGKASDARADAYLAGTTAERDRLLDDESSWKSKRNLMLAGLGATWIVNVLHASRLAGRTPLQAYVAPTGELRVAFSQAF